MNILKARETNFQLAYLLDPQIGCIVFLTKKGVRPHFVWSPPRATIKVTSIPLITSDVKSGTRIERETPIYHDRPHLIVALCYIVPVSGELAESLLLVATFVSR